MKYRTLMALGVAGAFGCSAAASAATFLCAQDPSDVSYKACTEISSDALVSSPSVDFMLLPDPGFVTYSSIESLAASDELASADLWLYSEPMVVTYFYTFDSALDDSAVADYAGAD